MIKTILSSACIALTVSACGNDSNKSADNAATAAGSSGESVGTSDAGPGSQPLAFAGSRASGGVAGASAVGAAGRTASGGSGGHAGADANSGDVSSDAGAGRGGHAGSAGANVAGGGGTVAAVGGHGGATGSAGRADEGGAGGTGEAAGAGGAPHSAAGAGGAAGARHAAGSGGAGGVGGKTGGAGVGDSAGRGGAGGSEATLDIPDDPSATGPWPVGVRTVTLDLGAGASTQVEIWYPAQVGSEEGKSKVYYNFADWLPPENGIDANAPSAGVTCDCYRNLPIDAAHGKYPVSILVHGPASFRTASTSQLAHWASRGFIAVAADHPGLDLRDTISAGTLCSTSGIPQDAAHTRDLPALIRALGSNTGGYAFLNTAIDLKRIAVSGHAQGALYAADAAGQSGVQLIMAWDSDAAISKRGDVREAVYLSGMRDKVTAYDTVVNAYEAGSLKPMLLAGIANAGHLAVTDLCGAKNTDGQDSVAIGIQYNVCGGAAFRAATQSVWDCTGSQLANNDMYIDQADGAKLVNYISTSALEEVLKGKDRSKQWADFKSRTSEGELRESR
jgi:Platelet-activating factor acetylhydrolase, isoform II